jgi:hypothetical protein
MFLNFGSSNRNKPEFYHILSTQLSPDPNVRSCYYVWWAPDIRYTYFCNAISTYFPKVRNYGDFRQHVIPMIITYMLQGTPCNTGIPRTFYGGTICSEWYTIKNFTPLHCALVCCCSKHRRPRAGRLRSRFSRTFFRCESSRFYMAHRF